MAAARLLIGLDFSAPHAPPVALEAALDLMGALHGDYCVVPLGSGSVARCDVSSFYPAAGDATALELLAGSRRWARNVCGCVSFNDWAPAVLPFIEREVALGAFLGLPAILLPPLPQGVAPPTDGDIALAVAAMATASSSTAAAHHPFAPIARMILRHCRSTASSKLWVPVPLLSYARAPAPLGMHAAEWRRFNGLRRMCVALAAAPVAAHREGNNSTLPLVPSAVFHLSLLPMPDMRMCPADAASSDNSRTPLSFDLAGALCWLGEELPAVRICTSLLQMEAQVPHAHGSCGHTDHHGHGHSHGDGAACGNEGDGAPETYAFRSPDICAFVVEALRRRAGVLLPVPEPSNEVVGAAIGAGQLVVNLHESCVADARGDSVAAFEDVLQAPVQPLGDDLQSTIYETFEEDTCKYAAYEAAVVAFLAEAVLRPQVLHAVAAPPRNATHGTSLPVHVTVLGAGRGPLVSAVLRAASTHNRQCASDCRVAVYVTAIEKNPGALLYLRLRASVDPLWLGNDAGGVAIVASDGRHASAALPAEYRCDAVVSELLGSFGDNELSPECIEGLFAAQDAAWRDRGVLGNAAHRVSIPRSYTAHVVPVHAVKAHAAAANISERTGSAALGTGPDGHVPNTAQGDEAPRAFQTPYVSRLTKYVSICATPCLPEEDASAASSRPRFLSANTQPVFTFEHGTGSVASEMTRHERRSFVATHAGLVTGLAGSFDTVLHPGGGAAGGGPITLSIVPDTHTAQMLSWFPYYFPLPPHLHLEVDAGDIVEVELWRRCCVSTQRVWYSWRAASSSQTLEARPVLNVDGSSAAIALASGVE